MELKRIYQVIYEKREEKVITEPIIFQIKYKKNIFDFFFSLIKEGKKEIIYFYGVKTSDFFKPENKKILIGKKQDYNNVLTGIMNEYLINNIIQK